MNKKEFEGLMKPFNEVPEEYGRRYTVTIFYRSRVTNGQYSKMEPIFCCIDTIWEVLCHLATKVRITRIKMPSGRFITLWDVREPMFSGNVLILERREIWQIPGTAFEAISIQKNFSVFQSVLYGELDEFRYDYDTSSLYQQLAEYPDKDKAGKMIDNFQRSVMEYFDTCEERVPEWWARILDADIEKMRKRVESGRITNEKTKECDGKPSYMCYGFPCRTRLIAFFKKLAEDCGENDIDFEKLVDESINEVIDEFTSDKKKKGWFNKLLDESIDEVVDELFGKK